MTTFLHAAFVQEKHCAACSIAISLSKAEIEGVEIRAHVERESNRRLHPTDVHGVITDVTLLLLEGGRRL
jgi:hypothetical protein